MATEMLQYMFLGATGFHFHVAHYAVSHAVASQIIPTLWKCVQKLTEWDFQASIIA